LDETDRRRLIQMAFNKKHNITPTSIKKSIQDCLIDSKKSNLMPLVMEEEEDYLPIGNLRSSVRKMEKQMHTAAKNLEFEKAAHLRDRIKLLRDKDLGII